MDLLFSKIDMLLLLHISGGEPFTYPNLDDLINYIVRTYNDKLGRLEMTTNGTIIPSEKLLTAMKNAELYLTVDDYSDALPQYRDKRNGLIDKLNEYGIAYRMLKADTWIDLDPFTRNRARLSNEQLRTHFETCAVPWQEYRDGKLWLCN
jgi:hypothetical protein